MADPLEAVAEAQRDLEQSQERFIAAVRAAYAAGYSLRKIADVTNYSHAGIRRLLDD